MQIKINTESDIPPFRQLYSEIREQIESRLLKKGDSLPSIRKLAEQLKVSPVTVKRAYNELEAEGIIETIQGRGSSVSWQESSELKETNWKAFWSYARRDDELSRGRISELADDIVDEYEFQTGNRINLFKDIDSIGWGESWSKEIQESLNTTVFFIPILTPTYLRRPACLGEFKSALRRLDEHGLRKLVYPIRYVNIDAFLDTSPDDELVGLIRETQHNDWTGLRYKNRDSEDYLTGIRRIVDEIIRLDNELSETQQKVDSSNKFDGSSLSEEDGNGVLEDLSLMETAMKEFVATMEGLSVIIKNIGIVANEGTAKLAESDKNKKGFAGRLAVTRDMASKLDVSSNQLMAKCSEFTGIINTMDKGMSILVPMAVDGIRQETEDANQMLVFFRGIKNLQEASYSSFESIRGMMNSMKGIEKYSRDLRSPVKKILAALTDFDSNEETIHGWMDMIDKTGIDLSLPSDTTHSVA